MRTRSAIGKHSRRKGVRFELDVAEALRAVYPEARRNLSQSRTARREGGDILGVPFHVECKAGARIDLDAALAQAEADTIGGMSPMHLRCVVVAKQDRKPAVVYARARVLGWTDAPPWLVVTIPAADWYTLLQRGMT